MPLWAPDELPVRRHLGPWELLVTAQCAPNGPGRSSQDDQKREPGDGSERRGRRPQKCQGGRREDRGLSGTRGFGAARAEVRAAWGEGAGAPRGRRRGGPARPVRRGLASPLGDGNGRSRLGERCCPCQVQGACGTRRSVAALGSGYWEVSGPEARVWEFSAPVPELFATVNSQGV